MRHAGGGLGLGRNICSDGPLGEIVARGTMIDLFLFVLFRLLRREAGAISVGDLRVVTLIADAAQNAMASDDKSVPAGMVLILTIVGWDYFDWLASRFPRARTIPRPPQLPLVLDGVIQWRNLRKEMVSEAKLQMHLREHGLEDISRVKLCCLGSDGHISVIEGR